MQPPGAANSRLGPELTLASHLFLEAGTVPPPPLNGEETEAQRGLVTYPPSL